MTKQTAIHEKTDRVMGVARELFFRQSFEKTTMEEIARAVPMSKATLYTVFQSKEQILLALCEAHCDRIDQMLLEKSANNSEAHLDCFMEMMKTMALSIFEEATVVGTPEALVSASAEVRRALKEKLERRTRIFQAVLDKAIAAKEISSIMESEKLCDILLATLTPYMPPYNRHFDLLNRAERPQLESLEEELTTLIKILRQGLFKL